MLKWVLVKNLVKGINKYSNKFYKRKVLSFDITFASAIDF